VRVEIEGEVMRVWSKQLVRAAGASALSASLLLVGSGGGAASGAATGGETETTVGTSESVERGDQLTIGHPSDPPGLDPAQNSGAWAEWVPLAYASLVYAAPDGSFQPWLAESWQYLGDDFRTFEITLREDAKYSDGTPVNAESVAAWIEYHAAGPEGPTWGGLESVEAVDEFTVRLTTVQPSPDLEIYFSQRDSTLGAIASPAALENPESLATMTAGAGPYVLDPAATIIGDSYVFAPNEHYFDQDAIYYNRVVVRIITEPTATLQALRTGEINVARGDFSTVEAAVDAELNVDSATVAATGLIPAHMSDGQPLADVRVRQALNYAVDRDAIVNALFGEYGEPTSQIWTEGVNPEFDAYYDYDPERAAELLTEAGYPNGEGLPAFGINLIDGIGQIGTPLIQAIAGYWSEIGVQVDIHANAGPDFQQARAGNVDPFNWMTISPGPFQLAYLEAMRPGGALNPNDNSFPELDAMYEQTLASGDLETGWQEMSAYTVEQALFVPVVKYHRFYFSTDDVTGVESTPERTAFAYAHEWRPTVAQQ
jgi:peptide/nickel transport system substrate-binding protein